MSVAAADAATAAQWVDAPSVAVRRHPISQSTKRLKVLQKGGDALSVTMAFGLAYLYRSVQSNGGFDSGHRQLLFFALSIPLWPVVPPGPTLGQMTQCVGSGRSLL